MTKIPEVKLLEAIQPLNSGTGEEILRYGQLRRDVQRLKNTHPERLQAVWDAEPGSQDELFDAKELAKEYLLRTSERMIESDDQSRDLWADRFTQGSIELFGQPDKREATQLISQEYDFLVSLLGDARVSQQHLELLLGTYQPIIESVSLTEFPETAEEESEVNEKLAIRRYGEAIMQKYGPIFDLVDTSSKSEFTPKDLKELFEAVIDWLAVNDDPIWNRWKITTPRITHIMTDPMAKKVKVGALRENASPLEAKMLIAHETLVHALKSKNGYNKKDKKLAVGLAENEETEEGLGILAEEAISGTLPYKAYDRYVDIALALGTVDGVQRSRSNLFKISYARQLIRAQLRGDSEESLSTLPRQVLVHIDRIYRGGLGDNLGTRQAIFTKDVAYYAGYKKMSRYITDQMAQGKSPEEIFAYLSQGKFDPTNPDHVAYLNKVNNKKSLK